MCGVGSKRLLVIRKCEEGYCDGHEGVGKEGGGRETAEISKFSLKSAIMKPNSLSADFFFNEFKENSGGMVPLINEQSRWG